MKRFLALFITSILIISLLTSCTGGEQVQTTPTPTPVPKDIDPSQVNYLTETWVATEIAFQSNKEYKKNAQFFVTLDASFTNRETGTNLIIPAFWDGGNVFRVRFAPTEYGIWDYVTICADDDSLNGLTGAVGANVYKGEHKIYKHGFVRAELGTKYFMYNDGTPFFYLGDTHWALFSEEFDSAGNHAAGIQTDSHFKYIVDKRVEQGFTVYQSEPINAKFTVATAVTEQDVEGFKDADRYFKYLAEKGIVHANSQFFFATTIYQLKDFEYLEKLSRYWVARYGAYPVLWTLGQEIDNPGREELTKDNDPWVKVATYMHKYDAYQHPLSAHMHGMSRVTPTGVGTGFDYASHKKPTSVEEKITHGGVSFYTSDEVTEATGHNWWATQTSIPRSWQMNFVQYEEFWKSNKLAIAYEGKYDHLWADDVICRTQAWGAYLSGLAGHGYGAQDIWCYKSDYSKFEVTGVGGIQITPTDKAIVWGEAIELESGYQMGYLASFMQKLEWWKLVPDFNYQNRIIPELGVAAGYNDYPDMACYTCAYYEDKVTVIHFYNQSTKTGTLVGLDSSAEYDLTWYNPRTGEYREKERIKCNTTDKNGKGAYIMGRKPGSKDWVMLLERV